MSYRESKPLWVETAYTVLWWRVLKIIRSEEAG